MINQKPAFIQHLISTYPGLSKQSLDQLISENLLSPHDIHLPQEILKQGQDFISACFELRENKKYQALLADQMHQLGIKDPGNKAIMMSYDFHLDENGVLKLIEINTNAAFLSLGYHMYLMKKQPLPVPDFNLDQIRDCIHEELRLFGRPLAKPSIVITDENPEQQRLYVEFLVCQELFKSWGWPTEIRDYREALKSPPPDFIYNRYTDFYFESPTSKTLREAYLNKTVCFSPHPYEYFLLADKERLTTWSSGFLETLPGFESQAQVIQKHLLLSEPLTPQNKAAIWARRKNLFFKPSQDHGSKGSFKGASISHKAFEELSQRRAIAQELVPAPELSLPTPEGPQNFRYDLRFYAYRGRLQLVLGRLYQGQTTNLRTPGGGFASVLFH